jgi:hypothetical protein
MHTSIEKLVWMVALVVSSSVSAADESSWDFAGDIAVQSRFFGEDPLWEGQDSEVAHLSFAATADIRWRSASGDQRASIMPVVRLDAIDSERSLIDFGEAYWATDLSSGELLLGANTVFWGVTESVHLVDIINQTDAAADLDGEQKLGQPMINLDIQRDWGLMSLYVMPVFRERTFAGVDGRLRAPLPVDTSNPQYESSAGQKHTDLALRYSHYFGDVDIGVSLFDGTSREPRLLPSGDGTALIPHYDQISQLGVDLQYTRDAWLWKLEAIVRDGYAETFGAAVGGFEYTHYQLRDSAMDLGLLLEYQYDGRSNLEPISINDNDVFAGARLAWNDVQNTSMLAGVGYDLTTEEAFFNVEGERRFGDDIVLELRLRAFFNVHPLSPTYAFANDNCLQLQVSKFF